MAARTGRDRPPLGRTGCRILASRHSSSDRGRQCRAHRATMARTIGCSDGSPPRCGSRRGAHLRLFGAPTGWWVPPEDSGALHVHLSPGAAVPRSDVVAHWSKPLGPARPRILEASVEDALAHAARCLALEHAVAMWESAARVEQISIDSLRQVRWRDAIARRCAEQLRPGTDSSLETIFRVRLSSWGVPVRMQLFLAGRTIDFLIGTHLIVQIDGWSFHSSSADRTRDIAHDAMLRMRGYTVLRFSYAQVIHRWPEVENALSQAIARRLHLRAA